MMAIQSVSRRNNHVTHYRGTVFSVDGPVLYVVGNLANGLIKIGISTDFRSRFMDIASQSPVPLTAIGVFKLGKIERAKKFEFAVHQMLTKAGRHSHGEWFRLNAAAIENVRLYLVKAGVAATGFDDQFSSIVLDTEYDEIPDGLSSRRSVYS